MIRALLADDHSLVRRAIARALQDEDDIVVVAQADNGGEVLEILGHRKVDVAVLDVTMPGPSVFDLLAQIRHEIADTEVLILSGHPESEFGVRLIRDGAAGYLTKDRSLDDLAKAIRKVASGHRYITESLAERLAEELQRPGDSSRPHADLSDREFEVLRLTAQGLPGVRIAEQLAIAPQTVSTHRARIREKLGLRSVAEMIRYSMERGLE